VLMREQAKANYPFVEYHADRGEYVLWYSGHSLDDPATRSSFRSVSKVKDQFEPAATPAIVPSGVNGRNDRAYATGPKRHRGKLYYSGRAEARGVYRGIFVLPDR